MSDLSKIGMIENFERVSVGNEVTARPCDHQTIGNVPGFTFGSATDTLSVDSNVVPHEVSSGLSTFGNGFGDDGGGDSSNTGGGRFGSSGDFPILPKAETTFLKAAKDGNLEAAKAVVGQINVNVKDEHNVTALYIAADKGYSTIVEWLLTLGADANIGQVSTITEMSRCDINTLTSLFHYYHPPLSQPS